MLDAYLFVPFFCQPCKLTFYNLETVKRHMQGHINTNCQGTKSEVRAVAESEIQWELLAETGLLEQHSVMGNEAPNVDQISCHGTNWELKAFWKLVENYSQYDWIKRMKDFQCPNCILIS